MKLSFHGADQSVTGSCHLLQCAGKNILIDCGLFQGSRALAEDNQQDFGFDASTIDFVLLTHAHLDHCGRLPLLYRRGFRGEIITTSASRDLARLVLLDSAHLQEAEARRREKHWHRHTHRSHSDSEPTPALYTTDDVEHCLKLFGRTAHYHQALPLAAGITAHFYDAGHILGSASIALELEEGDHRRRIVFSGDLGRYGDVILRDAEAPPPADFVVMETTYGDRCHRSLQDSVTEMYEVIRRTFQRNGNVIIPTFALERAQEILWYLREGVESGQLPAGLHVFLDSPMAISATEIFRHHPECYDEQSAALFAAHRDPFTLANLHIVRELEDSIAINQIKGGAVILAGAGMCTGGRIQHHLKHHLWERNSSIVFVGFAAKGTLARQIIDGQKSVRILGEEITVNAEIHTINGFSAHADREELLAWHQKLKAPNTFLVHGESEVIQEFAENLRQACHTRCFMPQIGDEFDLIVLD